MSSDSVEHEIEGVIRIINSKNLKTKFEEMIYIGLCIKSTRSKFEIKNWQEEREKFEPITLNFKKFKINKSDWYNGGKVFVIPTKTFIPTKLEIYLKEHVLLGTGFEINIYNHDIIKSVIFTNSETISTSLGGTISTTTEWQVVKTEDEPSIKFTSNENWSTSENQQPKRIRTTSTSSVN